MARNKHLKCHRCGQVQEHAQVYYRELADDVDGGEVKRLAGKTLGGIGDLMNEMDPINLMGRKAFRCIICSHVRLIGDSCYDVNCR